MQKFIFSAAIVLGLGVLVFPGAASAHSTSVGGTTECRASATSDWVVSWTIFASTDLPDLDWEVTSPSGYTPAGFQSSLNNFTRTAAYPSSQTVASETVENTWSDGAVRDASADVNRPPVCEEPPVTEPPVTEPPVTEPPVTEPPVTEPPATEPPATEPPPTDNAPIPTDAPPPTDNLPVSSDVPVSTDTPVSTEAPGPTDGTPDAGGPDSPDAGGPTLPATGRDGVKDMLTAALLLFGFGGLMISAARGRRSELLDL